MLRRKYSIELVECPGDGALRDENLLSSFPELLHVDQPLFQILDTKIQEKVKRVASGLEKVDSILYCYYPIHGGKINGEAQAIKYRSPKIGFKLTDVMMSIASVLSTR